MDVDRLLQPYFTLLHDILHERTTPERFREAFLARALPEEHRWPNRYVPVLAELLADVDAFNPGLPRYPDDLSAPQLLAACRRARDALRAVHAAGKPRRKPRTRRERRRRR